MWLRRWSDGTRQSKAPFTAPNVAAVAVCLGLLACVSPKAGDERRVTVQGTFVGGTNAATTDGGVGISGRLSFTPQTPQTR